MSQNIIKLAINGAAGRMGQRLIAMAADDDRLALKCAIEFDGHPSIGKDIGGVSCVSSLDAGVDVVIDFSLPAGTEKLLDSAVKTSTAMVIGTTGIPAELQERIDAAALKIPVLQAANYSVGVNLLLKLVAQAAASLGDDYDIEIVESHHRFKQDAPSGTALALAGSICESMGWNMDDVLKHGRSGQDPRHPRQGGQIGMHAVRLGDTVGEHAVHYGCLGETVTISHSAHSRDTFASGALRAARWLAGQPAGKYSMVDVLGY